MKKIYFKIGFDILMTVGLILAMVYSLTGGYWHEIIGLILLGAFILHNIFNVKRIGAVTKKVFKSESSGMNAAKYIVNMHLLIAFILVGGSGILISDNLFSFTTNNRPLWVFIHNATAWISLILISIHIGLHWDMIMGAFRKMFGLNKDCKPRKIVLRILALCLAILGIKANVSKTFTDNFKIKSDDESESSKLNLDNETGRQNNKSRGTNTDYDATANNDSTLNLTQTRGGGGHGTAYYDFSSNPPIDGESEDDYLGRINCTGCGKRCLLTNPQCGTGTALATEAVSYYGSYFDNEVNSDSDNNLSTDTQEQNNSSETQNSDNNNSDKTNERQPQQDNSFDNNNTPATENNSKSNNDNSAISNDNSADANVSSLDEYLGKLYCNGCGRHCSLLTPQCNKGVKQAEQAEVEYNSTYSNATSSNSGQQEIVFEDDTAGSLKKIFTTMIPIMGLYVAGTHYIVKITKRKKDD